MEYEELPDIFVIFICDFDSFGCGLYDYSFQKIVEETVNKLRSKEN